MDFIGPLQSSSGHKYILTIIDNFSKYVFLGATKNKTQNTFGSLPNLDAKGDLPDGYTTPQHQRFRSRFFIINSRSYVPPIGDPKDQNYVS